MLGDFFGEGLLGGELGGSSGVTIAWTYDAGAATLRAVGSGLVNGDHYMLFATDANNSNASAVASGGSIDITLTGVGGGTDGDTFAAYVAHGSSSSVSSSNPHVAANVFEQGTSST